MTGARYHHGDLRRALLDAAREMLEAGEELTLRAVARRAGVSHAAPYHHFADRRALLVAVAEEGLKSFREALLRGVERGDGDPGLGLLESGVAYVHFALENPHLFRLMFSAELADRGGRPELQAAYDAAYGVLGENVRRVLGSQAPAETVEAVALGAWATVHGFSMLILDNQVTGADTPDAVESLLRGVLAARIAKESGPYDLQDRVGKYP